MSTLIIIFTITLMVSANALYVAAEFATISARKTRIAQMAEDGHRLAKMLLPFLEDTKALDTYVAACQIGITISSLVLGAYGQNTVAGLLAPWLVQLGSLAQPAAYSISATVVLVSLTILQVVMGELFPKSIAIQYPEQLALMVVLPMKWSLFVFRPFIWLLNGSGNFLLKLMGSTHREEHAQFHSPEEIELLVKESHEGGLVDDAAQQMLRNALRLRELSARQVMLPRPRLIAAPVDSPIPELLTLACTEGYTRIPVYRDNIDNIVGFVHIKDLFKLHLQGQQDPAPVIRTAIFVPESISIADVWTTLNQSRQYIAIVIDEFGGTAGLITIEDLIEEIFGELQDEFDEELPLISSDKTGRIYLRGDLLVSDVNEYLNLSLPEAEADTLGGLILSQMGRLPEAGDETTIGAPGIVIRVEAMENRTITEISLQRPADFMLQVDAFARIGEWEVGDHD
jgi:putative hemolysin